MPMRLAYADPPYPGCAHLYPEKTEVDHVALIERLQEFDGWALSTNENALQYVLGICPPDVRILAWCKTNAPPFFDHPIRSWEPVLMMPARDAKPSIPVRSFLMTGAPTGSHQQGEITGQKHQPFCEWVIRCLGAERDDTLDDLFPGTGIMGQTWERWCAAPELLRPLVAAKAQARERIRATQGPTLEESAA
jgi:hypothetical protein